MIKVVRFDEILFSLKRLFPSVTKFFFFSCFFLVNFFSYAQEIGTKEKPELKAFTPEMEQIFKVYPKDFIYKAMELYRWKEVNEKLAKDLGISNEEAGRFTKYLCYDGSMGISDFYKLVYAGKITEKNALEYWMGRIPFMENLFKTKYSAFSALQKQKTDQTQRSPINNDPQPNTGGSICNNLDFSAGNESGWTGKWNNQGSSDPLGFGYGGLTVNGLNNSPFNSMGYVHELCNGGSDPWIPITRVPPGHSYSVRLGDDDPYGQGLASYNHQTIQNTFLVTQANKMITYWYAVNLLQTYGTPHPQNEQPYFKIRMYDGSNNEIVCARYDVDATAAASIGGFNYTADAFGYEFVWKDWSQVMIPLINYVGQNVTIKFESSDCDQGGHFGYAYLTVDCGPYELISTTPFLCGGNTATLTAPPGAATYSWTGAALSGATTNQSATITGPGAYTVTMTSPGNGGVPCTFQIDTIIDGAPVGPTASFTATTVCQGTPSQFTDQSNTNGGAAITGWNWNFGDGTGTSTAFNPSYTYAVAGTFTVNYTVTSSAGCTSTYSTTVVVNPKPIPAFTVPAVCLGSPSIFTNTSTPAASTYQWTFGDGNTSTALSPTNTYTTASTFNTKLVVTATTGGCKDSITVAAVVNPLPVPAFTAPAVCQGATTTFTNTTPASPVIANWSWNFGDANTSTLQNPTHVYASASTFTTVLSVSTTATPACTATFSAAVTVNPQPVAAFTLPADVCNSTAVTLTNTSTEVAGAGNNWDYTNDGSVDATTTNASFTYPSPGTYTIELEVTDPGGCKDSITHTVVVHDIPVPSFTPNTPCEGNATTFTNNTSINSPSTVASWSWDFTNDGTPDNTTQSPSFTFPAAGSYTTKLTATGEAPANCAATYTLNVVVNPQPVASFTLPADVCNNVAVTMNSTSTAGTGGTLTNTNWDYTNNGSVDATTGSTSFTFPSAGTYTVELEVMSNGGCKDSTTNVIVVHENPVPSFSVTQVCAGTATTYTNTTTINAPGTVSGWAWDFTNDGSTDNTTQNPSFIFPGAGTYTTKLTATGEAPSNCTATFSLAVTVNPVPVANFTVDTVCLGNNSSFNNLSSVAAPDNLSSTTWNFGDAIASVAFSPTHAYATCGSFNAILTVITNHGCNATFNSNVTVNCNPVAAFTNSSVCLNTATTFTDQSTAPGSAITNWAWDFTKDGTTDSNIQNPASTYTSDGTFNAQLIVTAANSCKDTIEHPVTVYPNPQVAFTTVNACDQFATSFNNTSTINSPGSIASWSWDFDNSGTTESSLQNPTYTFPGGPNTYNVLLTATSANSCTASATVPVTVYPNPTAAFNSTTVCQGTASAFTDSSWVTGAGNSIAQWHWDYDNNGTTDNTTQNPGNTYASFGAQTAELVVITNNGCKDSITKTVNVNPNPVAGFNVTGVCFGFANSFSNSSTINPFNGSSISGYAWDFDGNSTIDATIANPTHVFPAAGTYNSTLGITSNYGCIATITLPVVVYPIPVANLGSDPNCVNAPMQFTSLSSVAAPDNITAWNWDLTGDGISDAAIPNPTYTYSVSGTQNITLIVTTNHGCMDTVITGTVVNPNPVVKFTPDTIMGCPVLNVDFSSQSTIVSGNIVSYNWSFGDGTSSTLQAPPAVNYDNSDPLNPALFTVGLTVVSDSGCVASLVKTNCITVYPAPQADFTFGPTNPSPDITNPIVNFYDQSVGANSWSWDFGDIFHPGTGTSTDQNPVYNYNWLDPYTYNVQLAIKNNYGCVDTVIKPVPIQPEFTFYVPNAFTPNGDSINDGFRGYGIGIKDYTMWIYDRWGNLIFRADELNKEWDAKVQDRSDNLVQIDVYVWKVKLVDIFGRTHGYVGHVTVVR